MASLNHRQTLLKRNNRAQILLGVHKLGPISRTELARVTGLSTTCVCTIVSELLAEEVLAETGTTTGYRGGPMVMLEINPNGAPVAGIWFSYEEIDTVVGNPAGKILARSNIRFDYANSTPDTLITAMKSEVQKCMEAAGKSIESLRGVGLCVGGMVDQSLGIIVTLYKQYNQLEGVPIVRMLSDALEVPVYADNDVTAGAFASTYLSEDTPIGSTIYVTIGKGIGCAYVHSNDMLRGTHGMSCQFGRTIVNCDAPSTEDMHAGTLSATVTDSAFIRMIWPEMAEATKTMPENESTDLVSRGLELALNGEQVAYAALNKITRYIGAGIANLVNMLDPRTVFVGGTLINLAPEMILDMIRAEALRLVTTRARGVDIRPLMDYKEFVLRGSVGLVIGQEYRVLQEDNWRTRVVSKRKNRM